MSAETSQDQMQGKILCINHEKKEGRIRIVAPEVLPGPSCDVPFDTSDIVIDQRYIKDVIPGIQVRCVLAGRESAGVMTARQINLVDNMIYEGRVSSIGSRAGLAEVCVADLETPIVFTRTHLDNPEDFQKVCLDARVRVEIGFFNFVSETKPPRPNKVVLLDSDDTENAQPRPAASSSTSRPATATCVASEDARLLSPGTQSQPLRKTSSAPAKPEANTLDDVFPNEKTDGVQAVEKLVATLRTWQVSGCENGIRGAFRSSSPLPHVLEQSPAPLSQPPTPNFSLPPDYESPHDLNSGSASTAETKSMSPTESSSSSRPSSTMSHPANFFGLRFDEDLEDPDIDSNRPSTT